MRNQLTGLLNEKVLVDGFVEKIGWDKISNQRTILLKDVTVSSDSSDDYVDHMWVKAIKGVTEGSLITLRAVITEYKRLNNSVDYGLTQCKLLS